MITLEEVEKLRGIRSDEPAILSLYVPVPLDPAGLRELPARARELAEAAAVQAGRAAGPDRDAVAALVAARAYRVQHRAIQHDRDHYRQVAGRWPAGSWTTAARSWRSAAHRPTSRPGCATRRAGPMALGERPTTLGRGVLVTDSDGTGGPHPYSKPCGPPSLRRWPALNSPASDVMSGWRRHSG
jgi:hypothetical protein